jgi:phosphoribosylamine-glycine ligase
MFTINQNNANNAVIDNNRNAIQLRDSIYFTKNIDGTLNVVVENVVNGEETSTTIIISEADFQQLKNWL